MYDLDFFKKIHDQFGHTVGDDVLVAFAKMLKNHMRPKDYFFRYGGEEFISISTQLDLQEACKIPNRIRENLSQLTIDGYQHKPVTCSVGIAYWTPNDPNVIPEKLVDKADEQFYKAKEMGRNCTVMDGVLQE